MTTMAWSLLFIEGCLIGVIGMLLLSIRNLHQVIKLMGNAVELERERCANIALAIDSGRGNEKLIAQAIRKQPLNDEVSP